MILSNVVDVLCFSNCGVIDYGKCVDLVVVNVDIYVIEVMIVGGWIIYMMGEVVC